jgi:hypothetical protein
LACAALLAVLGSVSAQGLRFGVEASPFGVKPSVVLYDLVEGSWRAEFRLAGRPAGPLELGFGARTNLSFGPVGNLTVRGRLDVDTAGGLDASLSGDGVLGGVAARLSLGAFTVDPGHFDLADAFARDARPRHGEALEGQVGWRFAAGVSYRISRELILDGDAAVRYLTGRGFGAHLTAALRFVRLVENDDGVVLVLADLAPGAETGYAAAGFEYRVNRRDWPLVRAAVWLGAGNEGVWPGARLSVGSPQGAAWRYQLELAAEPFRSDALKYRLDALLISPIDPGEVHLRLLAAPAPPRGVPTLALEVSYRFGF